MLHDWLMMVIFTELSHDGFIIPVIRAEKLSPEGLNDLSNVTELGKDEASVFLSGFSVSQRLSSQ